MPNITFKTEIPLSDGDFASKIVDLNGHQWLIPFDSIQALYTNGIETVNIVLNSGREVAFDLSHEENNTFIEDFLADEEE